MVVSFMSKNSVATIYDVAGAARVSMATVSRVLNNPDKVNIETKEKVMKVVEELGYVPNPTARNLAAKKTTTINVVISDITQAFVPQIISGILSIAEEQNFSVNISPINKKKSLKDFIYAIIAEKSEGIIIINYSFIDEEIKLIEEMLDKYNVSYILIDKQYDNHFAYNVGAKAMEYLIKQK